MHYSISSLMSFKHRYRGPKEKGLQLVKKINSQRHHYAKNLISPRDEELERSRHLHGQCLALCCAGDALVTASAANRGCSQGRHSPQPLLYSFLLLEALGQPLSDRLPDKRSALLSQHGSYCVPAGVHCPGKRAPCGSLLSRVEHVLKCVPRSDGTDRAGG